MMNELREWLALFRRAWVVWRTKHRTFSFCQRCDDPLTPEECVYCLDCTSALEAARAGTTTPVLLAGAMAQQQLGVEALQQWNERNRQLALLAQGTPPAYEQSQLANIFKGLGPIGGGIVGGVLGGPSGAGIAKAAGGLFGGKLSKPR